MTATFIKIDSLQPVLGERVMLGLTIFIAAVSWSPLLPAFLRLSPTLLFMAAAVGLIALASLYRGLSRPIIIAGLGLTAAAAAALAVSQSTTLFARLLPLPLLIATAWHAYSHPWLRGRLCTCMSALMLIGVAGAIVGFFYAYFGGMPLLTITNPDGRGNQLYLTTMSNFWFAGTIRPCFIFDEPGAFSFAICATVLMRELLGKSSRLSYFLMVGGLITLSISHLIAALLYVTYRAGILKTLASVAAVSVILIPVLANNQQLAFFTDRFSVEDGQLAGDNRSQQLANFFDIATPRVFLLGDSECHTRPDRMCLEHGDITSSPVTPVYRGGIVLLIVQVLLHCAIALAAFKGRTQAFAASLLTLLLLQRPYFSELGYGFLVFFLLFLLWSKSPRPAQTKLQPSQ